MKHLLHIAILVFISTNLFAQRTFYPTWQEGDTSRNSISIGLHKNKYIISNSYHEPGTCSVLNTYISLGSFKQKGDTVVLRDTIEKYTMRLFIKDSNLYFMNGYEFMIGMQFEETSYTPNLDFDMMYNYAYHFESDQKTTRQNSLLQKIFTDTVTTIYTLDTGTYIQCYNWYINSEKTIQFVEFGYRVLLSPHSYKFYLENKLLTTGTWKRKGNYILFKDRTLNTTLIATLNKNNCFAPNTFPVYGSNKMEFRLNK